MTTTGPLVLCRFKTLPVSSDVKPKVVSSTCSLEPQAVPSPRPSMTVYTHVPDRLKVGWSRTASFKVTETPV